MGRHAAAAERENRGLLHDIQHSARSADRFDRRRAEKTRRHNDANDQQLSGQLRRTSRIACYAGHRSETQKASVVSRHVKSFACNVTMRNVVRVRCHCRWRWREARSRAAFVAHETLDTPSRRYADRFACARHTSDATNTYIIIIVVVVIT
jgi:hypothetical protein